MRTGLTKKQKTTVIYFDEHSRIIEVQTHNTDLKKRLTASYSEERRKVASEQAKQNGVHSREKNCTEISAKIAE